MEARGGALNLRDGDVVLSGAKSQGWVSLAIKLGQRLRGFTADERQWTHCYGVVDAEKGVLVEAAKKGVRLTSTTVLHEADYLHVPTNVDAHDFAQMLAFYDAVLNARSGYGFWTFGGLALYCATGGSLCIQKAGTAICSGLLCDALTRAGEVFARPPYSMMPGDLARHFGVGSRAA